MKTLYTVARKDGENRQYNLTLREAAQAILHHDGGDYEVRRADGDFAQRHGIHWMLWTRQQVAGIGWTRSSSFYSFEKRYGAARADIFAQIVRASGLSDWRGLVAEDQNAYQRSLDAMRAEEDDPECIDRIDAELAQMDA